MSSGISSKSSLKSVISALFTNEPPVAAASTVNSMLTTSLAPGARGPAIVIAEGPFAVKPAGT